MAGGASAAPFVKAWGTRGDGEGQFNSPYGVAVGPDGDVYVADTFNNRIEKFTADGSFLMSWGGPGLGPGELNAPKGVAVAPNGEVYVADTGRDRIQVFTSGGTFLRMWGKRGTDDGEFKSPYGVAVNQHSDDVYVADTGNNRIEKFTAGGKFVTTWGSRGSDLYQFDVPSGVGVDAWGDVYVADSLNKRIQKFNPDGVILESWPLKPDRGPGPAPTGVAARPFESPQTSRDVYISDAAAGVQAFGPTGLFIEKWGTFGSAPGQFSAPRGIAMAANGDLYVADTGNDRIEKFRVGGPGITRMAVRDRTKRDKIRPRRLRFNFPGGLPVRFKGLRPWEGWGKARTRAKAIERFKVCQPNCAHGHRGRSHARVRLSEARECAHHLVYAKIDIRARDRHAPAGTFRIGCKGKLRRP